MIQRLVQSFRYAGRGIKQTWKSELNFQIESLVALVVLLLGWWLEVGMIKFVILVITCGLVLVLEVVNTMIERISDLLKPRLDHYVRQIKDLSSAAVLLAALTAVVVGICLLGAPLWDRLSWQG